MRRIIWILVLCALVLSACKSPRVHLVDSRDSHTNPPVYVSPAPADGSVIGTNDNGYVGCPADHEMGKGEIFLVHAGCNIKGDVEVSSTQAGPWKVLYDSDQNTGLILSCTVDCWVRAPFGANVSPRNIPDLKSEMLQTGCGLPDGCVTVMVIVFPTGGTVSGDQPVECDPSIPKGQKALVPAGCVVSGDVAVSSSQSGPWKVLYDSDQNTGLVVNITADTWVFAPWGASANGGSVQDNVNAQKAVGCGLPEGCHNVKIVNWPS